MNGTLTPPPGTSALVVDDDAFARALCVKALAACGISDAREADGVVAARAALSERAADLVLCDLQMPDHDGIELARTLAAHGPDGALILVSGHGEVMRAAAQRIATDLGCRTLGALPKPIAVDALAALLAAQPLAPRPAAPRTSPLTTDEVTEALFTGRLKVMYQPILRSDDGALWGVECLARLRDADGGLIAPERFIATVERGGLADAFLDSLLDVVCADIARADAAGPPLQYAINLSPRNLDDPELPQYLEQRLAREGLPPTRFVLELTESQSLHDDPLRREVLTRLRLHGFGLALDDFGTGYSTIERLRDLPFTELKVDRGFVAGAPQDSVRRAILEHSASLGRSLGLRVIAEGVETADELAAVGAAGCALAQGYLFARPLPIAELIAWSRAAGSASPAITRASAC